MTLTSASRGRPDDVPAATATAQSSAEAWPESRE